MLARRWPCSQAQVQSRWLFLRGEAVHLVNSHHQRENRSQALRCARRCNVAFPLLVMCDEQSHARHRDHSGDHSDNCQRPDRSNPPISRAGKHGMANAQAADLRRDPIVHPAKPSLTIDPHISQCICNPVIRQCVRNFGGGLILLYTRLMSGTAHVSAAFAYSSGVSSLAYIAMLVSAVQAL